MQLLPFILLMVFSLSPSWGEEAVLQKVPLPNRMLRQGDALLIASGEGIGVRIALETRHLKKVEEKILASETENWPDSPDSQRYRASLQRACAAALAQSTGKIPFTIEWFVSPDSKGVVRLYFGDEILEIEDFPADYLQKNLAFIIADNFDMTFVEAEKWIAEKLTALKDLL